jgi:hypothetical protein
LGSSARRDVERSYSWEQAAETLERIYQQVTLRHGPEPQGLTAER